MDCVQRFLKIAWRRFCLTHMDLSPLFFHCLVSVSFQSKTNFNTVKHEVNRAFRKLAASGNIGIKGLQIKRNNQQKLLPPVLIEPGTSCHFNRDALLSQLTWHVFMRGSLKPSSVHVPLEFLD